MKLEKMILKEIEAKGILTKSKLPDADYVINPYIGCRSSCVYCYAEFMKVFTGHKEDWGTFVDVKINAIDLIKKNGKYHGKNILFGSATDAYQVVEGKYKITRGILKALIPYQPKIEILTKSALVTRDIDVLKQFNNATVGVSISTLNKNYSRQLEPITSSPQLRLEALKKCKEAGLRTYVFLSPMFPFITEVEEIMKISNDYADYFMFENLNLRPFNKKTIFDFIEKNEPDLLSKYKEIYIKKESTYWTEMEQKVKDICKFYGKKDRIYFHHGGFSEK